MVERETLHDLREMVKSLVGGREVLLRAEIWAREQSKEWPYGTYSPNDLPTMYEAGYLRGYLAGAAAAVDAKQEPTHYCAPGKSGRCLICGEVASNQESEPK